MKCYTVYQNKSTEQQATFKIIEEKLPDVLKRTWGSSGLRSNTFNILSVGCGDGTGGDFLILDIVKKCCLASPQQLSIFNEAIEPLSDDLDKFQASAESWAEKNKRVESCFQWFSGTWQQYRAQTQYEPKKFKLIHFIHSFYFMDVEDLLRDCMENRLADNGLILCFFVEEDSPFELFSKEIPVVLPSRETLVSIANKNGWKYEAFAFDYNVDVTEIFDESSVDGNLLFDFLTHTINYRRVTDKSIAKQIEQYWWEKSAAGSDAKKRLHGKVNALVFSKA